jgi:cob(I)alamin adenosyltransferase
VGAEQRLAGAEGSCAGASGISCGSCGACAPAPGGRWAAAILASVPRIYTRTGDDGSTGLLFGGRVSKADPVAEAAGAIDEAVAALGLARALAQDASLQAEILDLQRELFVAGADLATNPAERDRLEHGVSLVTPEMAERLEARIDELVQSHPLPHAFIVPGANPASAALDVARSAIRRAERRVVAVRDAGGFVNGDVLLYLNRLSDLLFVLARIAAGEAEPLSREERG